MAELRCLNCNEAFQREQGHCCLNSPWMLGTEDANTILQDIEDELDLDENEFISVDTEQLPELSTICTEILNRISDPDTVSSLPKYMTFGTDAHNNSFPVSFSEESGTYNNRIVSVVHAVPGPSRLPFNESEGSFCEEEFQPNLYHSVLTEVKQQACKVCHKVFKKKFCLNRHMKIHEGEKKHRCDFCEKSFFEKYNLQSHVRAKHQEIHGVEKPHKCYDCGKSYAQKSTLNVHFMSHTGEKPFPCDFCGKGFRQKSDLSRHMNYHTGNKFSCKICEKSFAQMRYLKMHARKHTDDKH